MNSSLVIKKGDETGREIFIFSGQIDEDANFDSVEISEGQEVVFDLENIEMINSCGIRDWVEFQKSIDSKVKIIYRNCPQVIIEQINIIKGFIKDGGVVESFYAPYYNEKNDSEVKILLTPDEVVDCKAPVKKDQEGNELEFNEIEQQYFNFLKK